MQTPQTRSRATAMGSPIYTRDPLNPSPLSVEGKNVDADDQTIDSLFQAPADLICPISQTLFRDPVLTAAGQVSLGRFSHLMKSLRIFCIPIS